jgi:hypothetical protein
LYVPAWMALCPTVEPKNDFTAKCAVELRRREGVTWWEAAATRFVGALRWECSGL